jgi:hypothetical protein
MGLRCEQDGKPRRRDDQENTNEQWVAAYQDGFSASDRPCVASLARLLNSTPANILHDLMGPRMPSRHLIFLPYSQVRPSQEVPTLKKFASQPRNFRD